MKRNNQFTIKINKEYKWLQYEDTVEACRILNGAALKLYIYLCSRANNEELLFSPKAFCKEMNLSPNSEKNAFAELLKNGYLINSDVDYYTFHAAKIG